MEAVLLGVQVFLAIALIGVVLIQRSSQDGFGLGSGSGSNFMTGRQSANLLTRATAILAGLFMLNSLLLTILAAQRSEVSIVDRIEAAQEQPALPAQSLEDAAADAFEGGVPLEDADAPPQAPTDAPAPKTDAQAPEKEIEVPSAPLEN